MSTIVYKYLEAYAITSNWKLPHSLLFNNRYVMFIQGVSHIILAMHKKGSERCTAIMPTQDPPKLPPFPPEIAEHPESQIRSNPAST